MRAVLINHTNHIEVQFNDAIIELKAIHETTEGAFPAIHKDIDSSFSYYRKEDVERWNLALDGSYIEVHFVSGHKMQMSNYVFEDFKNDTDNMNLLSTINSYLL